MQNHVLIAHVADLNASSGEIVKPQDFPQLKISRNLTT